MAHISRPIHRRTLIAPHRLYSFRFGPPFAALLLLIIALSSAACGRASPSGSPTGETFGSADRATALPSADITTAGKQASEPSAASTETQTEAPPFSQVTVFGWSEDEGGATLTVTGGTAAVDSGRYCLTPSGTDSVLATVPSAARTLASGAGVEVLSAEVLASLANVEGATVGLAACGVLLQVDDQQQWRQTPLGADGVPGTPGEWLADPGLGQGGQHALGILCEAGTTTLVGDGAILAQQVSAADAPPHIGLGAAIPSGAGEQVCFDDLRVEVWPEASGGDDRIAILAELGPPDAFFIAFEQDPAGNLYRVETWSYAGVGMTLTFADGVLIETGGLDASSEDLSAWPVDYDPLSFQPGMTLEAVQDFLAGQELVSLEVPEEFGAGMVLYAGDQIVLGFTEGELEFVETLPITVDTLGGEP